jgi:hypothetical protein
MSSGSTNKPLQYGLTSPKIFPRDNITIQVVNADGGFNAMSAARLEIKHPIALTENSGATATSGILRLKSGLVPAYIFLRSDDGVQNGAPKRNIARIEITLEPGAVFEMPDGNDWVPYEDAILPPRMVSPAPYMNSNIGSDVVAFSMGTAEGLRLGGEAKMFVAHRGDAAIQHYRSCCVSSGVRRRSYAGWRERYLAG